MDQLEITGTWLDSEANDDYALNREIMEFFLDKANVPVYIIDRRVVSVGGVVEYTAIGDLRNYETLVRFSEDHDLGLGFSDLS